MTKGEASIIQTVQKMVSEGESEEKIIHTLGQLGFSAEQAKRLLLVGQAETFGLLKKEIAKIVSEELGKEMPQYIKALNFEAREAGRMNREVILQDVKKRFDNVFNLERFEEEIKSRARSAVESGNIARQKLAETEKRLDQIQRVVEETRAKGRGTGRRVFSVLLLGMGVIFFGTALYLVFVSIQTAFPIEMVALAGFMAASGVAGVFLSGRV